MPHRLGEKVFIKGRNLHGVIHYVGGLQGKSGVFLGVELFTPVGKHDGTYKGRRLFKCRQGHGLFLRDTAVTSVSENKRACKSTEELNQAYIAQFRENQEVSKSSSYDGRQSTCDIQKRCVDLLPRFQKYTNLRVDKTLDFSDRPLFCLDLYESIGSLSIVTGGADHGLKVYQDTKRPVIKELYQKNKGHTEWVTTCKFTHSGKVISGGMDSKICCWDVMNPGRPTCTEIDSAHKGSISVIISPSNLSTSTSNDCFFSASYDKTAALWSVPIKGAPTKQVQYLGQTSPILDCKLDTSSLNLCTSSREGCLKIWDVQTQSEQLDFSSHKGQVSALEVDSSKCFTGDHGGILRVFDPKQSHQPLVEKLLHTEGAITSISAQNNVIVTTGADKVIKVIDLRRDDVYVCEITCHADFIYDTTVNFDANVIMSADGLGKLYVSDMEGTLLDEIDAAKAAIRCIEISGDKVVTCGDEGNLNLYSVA